MSVVGVVAITVAFVLVLGVVVAITVALVLVLGVVVAITVALVLVLLLMVVSGCCYLPCWFWHGL